jgi:REP element-mobilizing transposase RayT
MPRRLRTDEPGAWHHVMNRGISKRTLFETPRDVRCFLACLAAAVRTGDVEVHAYAVLPNHFHLLVRSPKGRLSAAMQRSQDLYARWFNRTRMRDGPLFRGRFVNRLIGDEAYWGAVLRYIDLNPVEAGLASHPCQYPHGSARHYARRRGPPWLARQEVEGCFRRSRERPYDPRDYVAFAAEGLPAGIRWMVEKRLEPGALAREEPLRDLLPPTGTRVRDWMERKALRAGERGAGWTFLAPETLRAVLADFDLPPDAYGKRERGLLVDAREVLLAGALCTFSGLTQEQAALWLGLPRGTVRERVRRYHRMLAAGGRLREDVARLLEEALRRDYGADPSAGLRIGGGVGPVLPARPAC